MELGRDIAIIRGALDQAQLSDWWEWRGGSTLFFWRWSPEYRRQARDWVTEKE